jgi:hypothetical protein
MCARISVRLAAAADAECLDDALAVYFASNTTDRLADNPSSRSPLPGVRRVTVCADRKVLQRALATIKAPFQQGV